MCLRTAMQRCRKAICMSKGPERKGQRPPGECNSRERHKRHVDPREHRCAAPQLHSRLHSQPVPLQLPRATTTLSPLSHH